GTSGPFSFAPPAPSESSEPVGRDARARAMRRAQLQDGARGPHARRTPCTLSVRPRAPTPRTFGGGLRPPSDTSPRESLRRQSRRSEVEHFHVAGKDSHAGPVGCLAAQRLVVRFERGLRPRNRF